ncbi:glycoside hydrolase family 28 protein [Paenibacillus contaminans]|uniref:glycoside hydrolase family 28 protein n=1 Tax=Paenibacillus contaminans TaxID=450362 RepID=UPI001314596C|nr:glycosyl hydrolase family 28 protein [Paenibacillus contaminans]
MNVFNIKAYGAAGDGISKDTAAVQAAINACAEAGGGTVYIPPGRFLVGTLLLKDHMTLWLEAGAVLLSSTDKEDFYFAEIYSNCANSTMYPGLLYGKNVSNITIAGRGCMDGQDQAFWEAKEAIGEGWNSTPARYVPKEWRPMMILLEDCSDIQIKDIQIRSSPVYSGWIIDCERVNLHGLQIINDFYGPNSDGFHFSSCRFVHIASCHFLTGDDSIAIDSNGQKNSQHFTITDCTFETSVNAFRIYTGLDPWMHKEIYSEISDIAINNCSVANAAGVVNVTAENGLIERINVSNITARMEQEGTAIFIMTGKGTVRRIQLQQWTVRSNGACTVIGMPDDCIEDIVLSGIQFEVAAKRKLYGLEVPEPIPSYAHHHFAPYALYFRYARKIRLNHVEVTWIGGSLEESWSAIDCKEIEDLQIIGFSGKQAGGDPSVPAIRFLQVQSGYLANCRALPGTSVFLEVSGSKSGNIRLAGNDLSQAGNRLAVGEEVGQEIGIE